MRKRAEARADEILDVVIEILDSEGYEAVQVRTVAMRARISLSTMYKLFGTLDDLIVTAVERWLEVEAYATLTSPDPDDSPYETLVGVLRTVFEPWERHPNMLIAYHWARSLPGGDKLVLGGLSIVRPIAEAVLANADAQYLDDLQLIHGLIVRAAIARFADGEIEVTDILPILERTLFRLMNDNRIGVSVARPHPVGRSKTGGAKTPRSPSTRRTGTRG